MNKMYIVLIAVKIGGAEKRFIDIFYELVNLNKNTFLVVSQSIADYITNELPFIHENVIILGNKQEPLLIFVIRYLHWLSKKIKEPGAYHYPINCLFFAHVFSKHQISSSFVQSDFNLSLPSLSYIKSLEYREKINACKMLVKHKLLLHCSHKVDVLNPSVYYKLIHQHPEMSKKISQTTCGTYVNLNNFLFQIDSNQLKIQNQREQNIVFMSRMIPKAKGIEDFLGIIKEVYDLIKESNFSQVKFLIAGAGPLVPEVLSQINTLNQKYSIPIEFLGYQPSVKILIQSNIFLSFQKVNNYPSRVVAEALLSGTSVIIRDNGESRLFGDPHVGIEYVNDALVPIDVSTAIIKLLRQYQQDTYFSRKIHNAAVKRFCQSDTIKYFKKLMDFEI
ncbi:glycosyltransferase [Laspinema olomoucense]|uniref:glycosyltransferase n=1 Tax=Laspinema olomoucense TaxID=3231600 RepID=UPI0021BA645B|nr:glycosyltransferase family 4 protein [Laspinema sp. D3d]MCT7975680.1 glycosyltransferase family 4 protein [Laspinema sp. D3d]